MASTYTQASVTLHFSVVYPTQWGQSIILSGSGALLGNLQWSRARQMSCHHEKDVLIWEATILLPWKPSYTYKYALVRFFYCRRPACVHSDIAFLTPSTVKYCTAQARQKDEETSPGPNVHGNWLIEKSDAAGERTVWLPEGLQARLSGLLTHRTARIGGTRHF